LHDFTPMCMNATKSGISAKKRQISEEICREKMLCEYEVYTI